MSDQYELDLGPGQARRRPMRGVFRLIQGGLSDPRTAALAAEREDLLRRIEELEHILSAGLRRRRKRPARPAPRGRPAGSWPRGSGRA